MTNFQSDDDRADPSEQPIRARVPEHVSGGSFSTGVIVMTAQTEFILDFVQNLGRPHQIVSRVVMPHNVLPQLVDALHRNMELYRGRWGELPQPSGPNHAPDTGSSARDKAASGANPATAETDANEAAAARQPSPAAGRGSGSNPPPTSSDQASGVTSRGAHSSSADTPSPADPASSHGALPPAGSGARQASAQEIYDDLKIRDELLSGAYANAVMIGHGPHEFSFDFITNFYPHSAVSARVFLAAGQVPRLYDSLRGTWDQLRQRMQPPGDAPPPFPPHDDSDDGIV